MEQQKHVKLGRRVAFVGGLLVVAAFLCIWGVGSSQQAFADAHPGLNFTMTVPGYAGCNTSSGNAQCNLPPGGVFTVNVTLSPLPSDVPSYEGYDIKLLYTGVTSADNASTQMWPDCAFPATDYEAGLVQMGCAIGITASPSTYTGIIGTNGFTCSPSGTATITMENRQGSTDLLQDLNTILWEPGGDETLNITCGTPPTPTVPVPVPTTATSTPRAGAIATATRVPGLVSTGSGGGQSPGDHDLTWLLVGSLVGLSGLAAMSWKFARSR